MDLDLGLLSWSDEAIIVNLCSPCQGSVSAPQSPSWLVIVMEFVQSVYSGIVQTLVKSSFLELQCLTSLMLFWLNHALKSSRKSFQKSGGYIIAAQWSKFWIEIFKKHL